MRSAQRCVAALSMAVVVVLVAVLGPPAPAFAAEGPEPARVVAAGTVHRGDIATAGQAVVIEAGAEVLGDVTTISGAITVRGTVRGDVVSYLGAVAVAPGGSVQGSVLALTSLPDVQGQVVGQTLGGRLPPVAASIVADTPEAGTGRWVLRVLAAALIGTTLATLSALAALAWPRRTAGAAYALRSRPLRALGLGLLTTVLIALLAVPLVVVLAASLIGLPLLPLLALLVHLPYLFGLGTLVRALAAPARPAPTLAIVVSAGMLLPLTMLGAFVPAVVLGVLYTLASAGLGAALLSRGGLIVR